MADDLARLTATVDTGEVFVIEVPQHRTSSNQFWRGWAIIQPLATVSYTRSNPEHRAGHGREVSTVVARNGSLICGTDPAFLAAATRAVMESYGDEVPES